MQSWQTPILPGTPLRLKWTWTPELQALSDIGPRLADPRAFWKRTGEIFRESFRLNFEAGGRPAWFPLKARTVRVKTKFFSGKPRPPFGKHGKPLPRLRQQGSLTGRTILIKSGKLRDSWVRVGAEGHVEEVTEGGSRFFIGSQYTLVRTLAANKPARHYHLFTKKALKARKKGLAAQVRIPLARIHEEGAPRANIPARQVGVVQDGDVVALAAAGRAWVLGELL